jgi:aquaporin Z
MADLARKLVAEFIGIFAICFVGILAINTGELVAIAFAFGLTVAVMVACFASVSGANLNPAATLALLATRRLAPPAAVAYILVQLLGAVSASLLLASLFGNELVVRGCTTLAPDVTPLQGVVMEAAATFLLLLAAFGTALNPRAPRGLFPWAIGFTVTMDIFAIGPLTGASLNPARSFGPALASGVWEAHWLYWLGPCTGAVCAAVLCSWLYQLRAADSGGSRTELA